MARRKLWPPPKMRAKGYGPGGMAKTPKPPKPPTAPKAPVTKTRTSHSFHFSRHPSYTFRRHSYTR